MLDEYRLPDGSTYLLSEKDAARLGGVPISQKAEPKVANKARRPRNKASSEEGR